MCQLHVRRVSPLQTATQWARLASMSNASRHRADRKGNSFKQADLFASAATSGRAEKTSKAEDPSIPHIKRFMDGYRVWNPMLRAYVGDASMQAFRDVGLASDLQRSIYVEMANAGAGGKRIAEKVQRMQVESGLFGGAPQARPTGEQRGFKFNGRVPPVEQWVFMPSSGWHVWEAERGTYRYMANVFRDRLLGLGVEDLDTLQTTRIPFTSGATSADVPALVARHLRETIASKRAARKSNSGDHAHVTVDKDAATVTVVERIGGHEYRAIHDMAFFGDVGADTQFFVDGRLVLSALHPFRASDGSYTFGDGAPEGDYDDEIFNPFESRVAEILTKKREAQSASTEFWRLGGGPRSEEAMAPMPEDGWEQAPRFLEPLPPLAMWQTDDGEHYEYQAEQTDQSVVDYTIRKEGGEYLVEAFEPAVHRMIGVMRGRSLGQLYNELRRWHDAYTIDEAQRPRRKHNPFVVVDKRGRREIPAVFPSRKEAGLARTYLEAAEGAHGLRVRATTAAENARKRNDATRLPPRRSLVTVELLAGGYGGTADPTARVMRFTAVTPVEGYGKNAKSRRLPIDELIARVTGARVVLDGKRMVGVVFPNVARDDSGAGVAARAVGALAQELYNDPTALRVQVDYAKRNDLRRSHGHRPPPPDSYAYGRPIYADEARPSKPSRRSAEDYEAISMLKPNGRRDSSGPVAENVPAVIEYSPSTSEGKQDLMPLGGAPNDRSKEPSVRHSADQRRLR